MGKHFDTLQRKILVSLNHISAGWFTISNLTKFLAHFTPQFTPWELRDFI